MTRSAPTLLTAPNVLALMARLDEVAERVVLVGGQAVNVWAEHYLALGRVPELVADAPFASKDVDFCASREAVRAFAARLPHGRAKFASLDDATPNVGVVMFVDDAGHERLIDFLSAPFGMNAAQIERESILMDVLDAAGEPTGRKFRVMHPIACLESRVHNVVGLAEMYDTPHGRKQLRAAVACAHEALKDLLDAPEAEGFDPVRAVLDLNERIFDLCLRDHHGRLVHQRTGIDPFGAVLIDDRLGERFVTLRYPQVRDRLTALRKKLGAP